MTIEKDKRIDGEYDPPYSFNANPTEEQLKKAEAVKEKYKKMMKNKKHPE